MGHGPGVRARGATLGDDSSLGCAHERSGAPVSPSCEHVAVPCDVPRRADIRVIGLLMPINWPEPFGLVMIEALACGTPVIAFNRGSVPEIIEDGLTGFVVEDETSAIGAVNRLGQLSREQVRKRFEERFTARRMAKDYLAVYRSLIAEASPRPRLVAVQGMHSEDVASIQPGA